jgi:CDGSH iron-sulfur domain-containing protein 3
MSTETTATSDVIAPIEVSLESGKTYWWCSCGRSRNQPFCDGSHKGTSFSPLRYEAVDTGTKCFCVCKQTAARPFCDATPHLCAKAR